MTDYSASNVIFKITDKEKEIINLLTEILDEKRSEIMRRLLYQEAKRAVAYLDDEEIPLWLELIRQAEMERDMMGFQRGEAISEGRRRNYKEKTGIDMDIYREREMDELRDKQRQWQRNHRRKIKMEKLKALEGKWNEGI